MVDKEFDIVSKKINKLEANIYSIIPVIEKNVYIVNFSAFKKKSITLLLLISVFTGTLGY